MLLLVDADELVGLCGVGRQHSRAMAIFILTPQLLTLGVGFIFLLSGGLFRLLQSHSHRHRCSPVDNHFTSCSDCGPHEVNRSSEASYKTVARSPGNCGRLMLNPAWPRHATPEAPEARMGNFLPLSGNLGSHESGRQLKETSVRAQTGVMLGGNGENVHEPSYPIMFAGASRCDEFQGLKPIKTASLSLNPGELTSVTSMTGEHHPVSPSSGASLMAGLSGPSRYIQKTGSLRPGQTLDTIGLSRVE
ncbi:unnamed protein product, partial [Protopolystoma xenopodis]